MFRKKNKEIIQVVKCNTDKNANECSIVAEIHKLQERRDILNEELKELEIEISAVHIPISSYLGRELGFHCYHTRSIENYNLDEFAKYASANDLYDISLKLNKLAQMKEQPEAIDSEISRIDTRLKELKEQLGIK